MENLFPVPREEVNFLSECVRLKGRERSRVEGVCPMKCSLAEIACVTAANSDDIGISE